MGVKAALTIFVKGKKSVRGVRGGLGQRTFQTFDPPSVVRRFVRRRRPDLFQRFCCAQAAGQQSIDLFAQPLTLLHLAQQGAAVGDLVKGSLNWLK